ncbi:MAG: rod shape-determining protein MreC, partial [Proteobacteria bacterium]|nr:rod shape-determining protein MreC [Pseudomonadota bacterium]
MSRVAPTSGSKLLYFLCICISGLFIYMDLNYKSFEGIKHTYKSFVVSSNYFLKLVTVDLVSDFHQMTKQKSQLIAENLIKVNNKQYLDLLIENKNIPFW